MGYLDTLKQFFSGKSMAKKGQALGAMSLIAGLAITLGIAIITASLAVDVVDNFQASQTADSLAFNASASGLTGLSNFTDNFTTIGTVAGAVVLISLVVGGLGVFVGRRMLG